jgi:hypothetical protein
MAAFTVVLKRSWAMICIRLPKAMMTEAYDE